MNIAMLMKWTGKNKTVLSIYRKDGEHIDWNILH